MASRPIPPSNIPFLALGAWILCVGWFGFNVMSAQTLDKISGLVAVNSLMAMVGGTLAALIAGKNDPGFVHNGPLAGLVAVCAGSDLMHPLGALVVGAVAGLLFVVMFTATQNRWKIDDVLGVWPLHGLCGTWGGIAAGIFGQQALGGLGGVSFGAQLLGTAMGVTWALLGRDGGLRAAQAHAGPAAGPGRGIRRRRLEHPQDQRHARPRSQLVSAGRCGGAHQCATDFENRLITTTPGNDQAHADQRGRMPASDRTPTTRSARSARCPTPDQIA